MELKKFAIKLGNYFRKAVGIDDIYTIAIRKKLTLAYLRGTFPHLQQFHIQRNTGMRIQF